MSTKGLNETLSVPVVSRGSQSNTTDNKTLTGNLQILHNGIVASTRNSAETYKLLTSHSQAHQAELKNVSNALQSSGQVSNQILTETQSGRLELNELKKQLTEHEKTLASHTKLLNNIYDLLKQATVSDVEVLDQPLLDNSQLEHVPEPQVEAVEEAVEEQPTETEVVEEVVEEAVEEQPTESEVVEEVDSFSIKSSPKVRKSEKPKKSSKSKKSKSEASPVKPKKSVVKHSPSTKSKKSEKKKSKKSKTEDEELQSMIEVEEVEVPEEEVEVPEEEVEVPEEVEEIEESNDVELDLDDQQ